MIGLLMNMERLVEWELAGETEVVGESLLQCHFVHHKSHITLDRTRTAAVEIRRLTARVYGTAKIRLLLSTVVDRTCYLTWISKFFPHTPRTASIARVLDNWCTSRSVWCVRRFVFLSFNPLKTEFLLNNIYKFSSYLTGNILCLRC
jgi:hypothetical protein